MYLGKKIRLERIINRTNGRTIIVPMDHGVTIGAVEGLVDMRDTVNDMATGGAGISVGRNVFQHPNRVALVKALRAIVHDNASVDQAMEIVGE